MNSKLGGKDSINMVYAPILVTTLNRYESFKRCIESLKKNSWADKTEVFISVDYPPAPKYYEGYNKIKEYLGNGITGFKKVNIFFQEKNLGVIENCEWLRSLVCKSNDRYIFLEDDNELAPGFIQFCDKGLEIFEKDETVFALNASDYVWCGNGYTPPVRRINKNENNVEKRQLVYHSVAYWEHKRKRAKYFCEEIENNEGIIPFKYLLKLKKKSKCLFYNYLWKVALQKKEMPWYNNTIRPIDFMLDIYMIIYDKYVIYPVEPMQRDLGVDGNGANYTEKFQNAYELKTRTLKSEKSFEYYLPNKIRINNDEFKLHDKNDKILFYIKIKILLKYIIKAFKYKR